MIQSALPLVSAGSLGQTSYFLSAAQDVYVCGNNEYGQLGLGHTTHLNVPQKLVPPFNKRLISLSSGARHAAFVTEDGKLYTYGHNDQKQCGPFALEKIGSPSLLNHPAKFLAVSCGNNHTLALSSDFKVYSWGSNNLGQLGVSHPQAINAVVIPERVVSISAGHDHSAALTDSGTVYTWGCNSSGQLGLEHSNNVQFPEKLTSVTDKIIKISSGYMHTAVLSESGDLYIFGFIHNDLKFGQSGKKVGSFPLNDAVKTLCSGSTHLLVLTNSGNVFGMGVNGHGQLAIDGKLITQLLPIAPLRGKKINQINTGFQHSLALTATGQVLAFGRNERGQLGIGHNKLQPTPAPVNIPNVNTIVDIFHLSQMRPLINSGGYEEHVESLPLPETVYHEEFNLDFQGLSSQIQMETIDLPPNPQAFSIVGKKK